MTKRIDIHIHRGAAKDADLAELKYRAEKAAKGYRYYKWAVSIQADDGPVKRIETVAIDINDVKSQIKETYGTDVVIRNVTMIAPVKDDNGHAMETALRAAAIKRLEFMIKALESSTTSGRRVPPGKSFESQSQLKERQDKFDAKEAKIREAKIKEAKAELAKLKQLATKDADFDRLEKATALLGLINRYLSANPTPEQSKLLNEAKGHAETAVRTLKADKMNPNGGSGVSIKLITTANQLLTKAKQLGTKDASLAEPMLRSRLLSRVGYAKSEGKKARSAGRASAAHNFEQAAEHFAMAIAHLNSGEGAKAAAERTVAGEYLSKGESLRTGDDNGFNLSPERLKIKQLETKITVLEANLSGMSHGTAPSVKAAAQTKIKEAKAELAKLKGVKDAFPDITRAELDKMVKLGTYKLLMPINRYGNVDVAEFDKDGKQIGTRTFRVRDAAPCGCHGAK